MKFVVYVHYLPEDPNTSVTREYLSNEHSFVYRRAREEL